MMTRVLDIHTSKTLPFDHKRAASTLSREIVPNSNLIPPKNKDCPTLRGQSLREILN